MSEADGTGVEARDALSAVQQEVDAAYRELDADVPNLCYALYSLIMAAPAEHHGALFRYTMEHDSRAAIGDGEQRFSSKKVKLDPVLSQNDVVALRHRLAQLVDGFIEVILDGRPDVEDVYQRLAAMLSNPIFQNAKESGFAFYWCFIDKRLPYFRLEEGLTMSDDDWRDLGIALRPGKAKIRYILATDWPNRSSEADLLLRVIDEYKDAERVRLMAFLVWELNSRASRAMPLGGPA